MKTNNETKLCPFCGSYNIEVLGEGEYFYCYCSQCEATGPSAIDVKSSINSWNWSKE